MDSAAKKYEELDLKYFSAVAEDDLDSVKEILRETGLEVDVKMPIDISWSIGYRTKILPFVNEQLTAVHVSIRFRSLKVLDYFWSLGIIQLGNDYDYVNPLKVSVIAGHVDVIRFLIEKFHISEERERDMFLDSVFFGNIDVVTFFLGRGRININKKDDFSYLCNCPFPHSIDMFNLLLDAGADVNQLQYDDYDPDMAVTPLFSCINRGNIDAIKQMIRCVLDINVPCGHQMNGIFYAAERISDAYPTPDLDTAKKVEIEIFDNLLANCCPNLELRDNDGNTILHKMINSENDNKFSKSVIELLLKYGASLDSVNDEGQSIHNALDSKPEMREFVSKCLQEQKI